MIQVSTWYGVRKKIFEREEVKERAVQVIREISEEYGFDVVEMEVSIEHHRNTTQGPAQLEFKLC